MWFPFLYLKGGSNIFLLAPDKVRGRSSRFSAGQIGLTFLCQCTLIPHRISVFSTGVHLHSWIHILLSSAMVHTAMLIQLELTCCSPELHSYVFGIYLSQGPSTCYPGWTQKNPESTVYKRIFAYEDKLLNLFLVLRFLTPALPMCF